MPIDSKEKWKRYTLTPNYRNTVRKAHLKFRYGITGEEYDRIFLEQDGKCAICGESKPVRKRDHYLHVDHDHVKDIVRGLLCDNCNKGLGHFKDSISLLQKAIEYLKKSE